MRFLLATVLCCLCLGLLPAQPPGVEDLLAPAGVLELKESSRESLVSGLKALHPHPLGWIVSEDWLRGRPRVLLFSPEGAFVRQVGRLGQGPGEYNGLQTIAVLEDHSLLVANANPCFVNRYDKDLVFRKR